MPVSADLLAVLVTESPAPFETGAEPVFIAGDEAGVEDLPAVVGEADFTPPF